MKLSWLVAAVLALVVAPASHAEATDPAQQQTKPATADDSLIGIWASETTFGPALRGELTVTREGSTWRATLASAESKFEVTGDQVRCAFPGNLGKFRGTLTDRGRVIEGFWLQPSGVTEERSNPVGSRQPFATPLLLQRAGRNVWRGTVRPLEERFTLYLRIFRDAEGSLIGAFRNPDFNSRGGASHFRVSREGGTVQFNARLDETSPEIRHSATLAGAPERLQIFWPDVGRVVDLTRRAPEQAANFFPRPPGEPAYAYRTPPETGDG